MAANIEILSSSEEEVEEVDGEENRKRQRDLDEDLAQRLQHEEILRQEEEDRMAMDLAIAAAMAADASPMQRNFAWPRPSVPAVKQIASDSILSAASAACPDAMVLLHSCFAGARDLPRSEVILCGQTPWFVQDRLGGGRGGSARGQAQGDEIGLSYAAAVAPDNWSCGYRNVQMLTGHLLNRHDIRHWAPQIFNGAVPGVEALQGELDRLWSMGYDPEGCAQLGGAVTGTRRWIGTTEACVLLRGQGVRCNVEAFPRSQAGAAGAVMQRAWDHFRSGVAEPPGTGKVQVSSQPPLYLQHSGHSRTIVGVQRRHETSGQRTDFLLVLDPGLGRSGLRELEDSAQRGHGWERKVKKSLAPLAKQAQYELLVVNTSSPILTSEMHAAMCVTRRL
mmetsp:Transcript_59433/g.109978  ORF Transcript_59433/g.109978 Transcript_59433/m.109978 type:complete len:392 (-) Transcript_59433:49-1224(-)